MSAELREVSEELQAAERRYEELGRSMADPAVFGDRDAYRRVAQEHARLGLMVAKYRACRDLEDRLSQAEQVLAEETDEDLRQLAREEMAELTGPLEAAALDLRLLLLPHDPRDDKNVIMEVRAGTGGNEAALFAADLFRQYSRYAERNGWRTEVLGSSETDIGGFKEIVFLIAGDGAYSRLRYESGVHRVQRVPQTEAQGRIHTSTATVAVLPEAEEVDVEVNPDELRVDTFCSSGPGGQSVNTTYSAVRITHLPTGLVVSCQDEKSQHKNRDKAMRVLRARLLDLAQQAQHAEMSEERRSQVGTGDRSERIRTYNYPQNRVTDHRIGLTLHRLEAVLDGDISELLSALASRDQADRLRSLKVTQEQE
ncbi:MAG: peptide chain release factor 1 [Bacillota bacterium]|nr:peptide chain release factor 1 [Bacillota bacterium]